MFVLFCNIIYFANWFYLWRFWLSESISHSKNTNIKLFSLSRCISFTCLWMIPLWSWNLLRIIHWLIIFLLLCLSGFWNFHYIENLRSDEKFLESVIKAFVSDLINTFVILNCLRVKVNELIDDFYCELSLINKKFIL